MTNKTKFYLAFLLTLLAGSIYWYGHEKDVALATGFLKSNDGSIVASQLLLHWRQLPVVHGITGVDWWQKQVIIGFVFNISDCGLCLARMDELVAFVDSLANKRDIGLLCVGIARERVLLNRYVAVSPKPCPVLQDTSLIKSFELYISTPEIIIIDRRNEINVAIGSIGASVITQKFRTQLEMMLLKGW